VRNAASMPPNTAVRVEHRVCCPPSPLRRATVDVCPGSTSRAAARSWPRCVTKAADLPRSKSPDNRLKTGLAEMPALSVYQPHLEISIMETNHENEAGAVHDHAPKKLTFAENLRLTIKVFAIAGLILAALWGANHWIAPN